MWAWLFLLGGSVMAATYEVGPGKRAATPSDVPWESIAAGDTILINWRPEPYRDKWVIARTGTATAPITVRGVPGPGGELPIIDGENAVTRQALSYDNEDRAVIKIGDATVPRELTPETYPNYIVIENLEIRGARRVIGRATDYTSFNGRAWTYAPNAAGIFISRGRNITIRNCSLHNNHNGIFVGAGPDPSGNILVERNRIYNNGHPPYEPSHNAYSEGTGITYQYNYFGPMASGSPGNNLKDRSAGTVIRYNWIEGGNRQLDLVDSQHPQVLARSDYATTHVYGNVLIDHPGEDNAQVIHYGGDSQARADFRNGTLHLYNNTIVSLRTDLSILVRLSLNTARADIRNNVYYSLAREASLIDDSGTVEIRNNWLQRGYLPASTPRPAGTVNDGGGNLTGTSPGFISVSGSDFRPAQGSPLINAGTGLAAAVAAGHPVLHQYDKHASFLIRPRDAVLDIGAFEFGVAEPPPPPTPNGPTSWTIPRLVNPGAGFRSVTAP